MVLLYEYRSAIVKRLLLHRIVAATARPSDEGRMLVNESIDYPRTVINHATLYHIMDYGQDMTCIVHDVI
jgi:hypothetical protein